MIPKSISNRVAHNHIRAAQKNPFKCLERPCRFDTILYEKSKLIYSYSIHQNYALIRFVIYDQEIEFQPCYTQLKMCSIGKSNQMRGTSLSI